jgi:hypothetical protein
MSTTASSVAGAFRSHLPGLRDRKLHALLYLAQGICLVANGQPLFAEPITPTATGVLIDLGPAGSEKRLDDAAAAVVRVVVARYGALTGADLEALIRGQEPWQNARHREADEIVQEWIGRYFRAVEEDPDGTVTGIPRSARAHLPRDAGRAQPDPGTPDSAEEIAAFIAEVRARG